MSIDYEMDEDTRSVKGDLMRRLEEERKRFASEAMARWSSAYFARGVSPLAFPVAADDTDEPASVPEHTYDVDSFKECLVLLQMAFWLKSGTVFRVRYRYTGNVVALKKFKSRIVDETEGEFINRSLICNYEQYEARSQKALLVNRFVYRVLQKLGIEK